MTDNEIIKGWEWHISPVHSNGTRIYSEVVECSRELAENTLSLINRQKSELEKKDIEIDILIRKKEALNDEISDLRVEVEILTGERDCLAKLEKDNLYEKVQSIKNAKSEAIKEFAERLKEHTTTAIFGQGKYSYEIVTEQSIDNLVKEMTEGGE